MGAQAGLLACALAYGVGMARGRAKGIQWTNERRRLGDLRPQPDNPREIDREHARRLRESWDDYGQVETVAVGPDGDIYNGHQRYLVLLAEHGPDYEVDVRVATRALTDEEREELAIRLNRNRGEWDFDALQTDFHSAELLNYGFEALDLEFDEVEVEPTEVDGPAPKIDEAEALAEKWGTATGQVWVAGRHRLVCGDATDSTVAAAACGGRLPLLCVTDPPYGVGYEPGWREALNEADRRLGEVENDDRADWAEAFRLFGGDVVYCWHSGVYASISQAMLEAAGFAVRAEIVWSKPHFVIGRGHYHWQHEPCWYAVRDGATAHWAGDRSQTTVWQVPLDEAVEGGHGTQKPLECMARPIRNHEGDVYDPFVGSGTTLIAAERLGRACYGGRHFSGLRSGQSAAARGRWPGAGVSRHDLGLPFCGTRAGTHARGREAKDGTGSFGPSNDGEQEKSGSDPLSLCSTESVAGYGPDYHSHVVELCLYSSARAYRAGATSRSRGITTGPPTAYG